MRTWARVTRHASRLHARRAVCTCVWPPPMLHPCRGPSSPGCLDPLLSSAASPAPLQFPYPGCVGRGSSCCAEESSERGRGPRGGAPLGPDGSAPCLPGRWPRAQLGRAGGSGTAWTPAPVGRGPGEWGPGASETRPPLLWALGANAWPTEVSVWWLRQ